jgi:hypothetical protein
LIPNEILRRPIITTRVYDLDLGYNVNQMQLVIYISGVVLEHDMVQFQVVYIVVSGAIHIQGGVRV